MLLTIHKNVVSVFLIGCGCVTASVHCTPKVHSVTHVVQLNASKHA